MPRMRYSKLEIRSAIIIIDILSKLVSLHFTNLLLWASVISWSNSSSFHITCSGLNKHEISTSSTSFTLPTAIQFGFAWEEKQLQVTTDERWNECTNIKSTTLNKPLAARWLPSSHSGLKKREESWVRVNFRKDFWDCLILGTGKKWPTDDRRVPNNHPRNNCGTQLGSSSLLDSVLLGIRLPYLCRMCWYPRHLCRLSLLALFRRQHQLDQPKTETGGVRKEQRTKGGLSRDGEMKG